MTLRKHDVAPGIAWVELPERGLGILCGCPADSVKHLYKQGLIQRRTAGGVVYEDGPQILLLSDTSVQNDMVANLAEFPVLQMFYRQGWMIPRHPNNTGARPLLVGTSAQLQAQLEYIHRGHYGLLSEEEMSCTGLSPEEARERMQMKLCFAFGHIPPPQELLSTRVLADQRIELAEGLGLRRLRPNVFEFDHGEQRVCVDLNLGPRERYTSPVELPALPLTREDFAVVHCGEGDGWDIRRHPMASIVMHAGRCYLIDAGPAVLDTLHALGLGLHDVEGLFHTHAHDDHFAGLPLLMQSERRIRYFATPQVRASVQKKLSALLAMPDTVLDDYFEVHELACGHWNEVDGMQVRPVFSPHPIETTAFYFRCEREGQSRVYGHLADIASLQVLHGMVDSAAGLPGVSRAFVARCQADYFARADLKKIDIGGGMIHGQAQDFRHDPSERILLSHTSAQLSPAQREIGLSAEFGQVDVLFPATDRLRQALMLATLKSIFPKLAGPQLQALLSHEQVLLPPEVLFIQQGQRPAHVDILLSGRAQQYSHGQNEGLPLPAAGPVGVQAALLGHPHGSSCRTLSHVHLLRIPVAVYRALVQSFGSLPEIMDELNTLESLARSELLRAGLSYPLLRNLVQHVVHVPIRAGEDVLERLQHSHPGHLLLVTRGAVGLSYPGAAEQRLGPGAFFGEDRILQGAGAVASAIALEDGLLHALPWSTLAQIPLCRWRVLQAHRRRTGTDL